MRPFRAPARIGTPRSLAAPRKLARDDNPTATLPRAGSGLNPTETLPCSGSGCQFRFSSNLRRSTKRNCHSSRRLHSSRSLPRTERRKSRPSGLGQRLGLRWWPSPLMRARRRRTELAISISFFIPQNSVGQKAGFCGSSHTAILATAAIRRADFSLNPEVGFFLRDGLDVDRGSATGQGKWLSCHHGRRIGCDCGARAGPDLIVLVNDGCSLRALLLEYAAVRVRRGALHGQLAVSRTAGPRARLRIGCGRRLFCAIGTLIRICCGVMAARHVRADESRQRCIRPQHHGQRQNSGEPFA